MRHQVRSSATARRRLGRTGPLVVVFALMAALLVVVDSPPAGAQQPVGMPDLERLLVVDGNPFLGAVFDNSNVGTDDIAANWFAVGDEVQKTAFGFTHPQSPNVGDPAYGERLFLLMDHVVANAKTDFTVYHQMAHSYGLLVTNDPGSISADRVVSYETYLSDATDAHIASRGEIWVQKQAELVWYNADVRWALGIYLAGVALDNPTYRSYGSAFFDAEFQADLLLGDGGFHYVGRQNEVYTYHSANMIALAWYYVLTRDEAIRDVIEQTAAYYPLSTFGIMGEYYTASSWKHYWNSVPADPGAYIVWALSGDPYNLEISQTRPYGHAVLAFLYNPGLVETPAPQPDNYAVYDRNIEGPRGRYGTFGYAATARVTDNYPIPTQGVGKSTIAGAHVLAPGTPNGFSFDSVVDTVGMEIKVRSGSDLTNDRRFSHRFLTTDERSSTTSSHQIHGVTSTYNPSSKLSAGGGPFAALDWVVHEQWVLLPDRMVGQLTVNSLVDGQQAYEVGSIIKFLSGRGHWGTKKDVVDLGDGHYSYGEIHVVIKEESLGGETVTEYAPNYGGDLSEKGTYLRVVDEQSSGLVEQLHTYDIDDKYHYVVEVFENGTTPATVTASRTDTVHVLTVDDGERTVQSVMNITEAVQSHPMELDDRHSGATLLRSWGDDESVSSAPVVTIPAHQSAMAIGSSTPEDLDAAERFYEDVFSASASVVPPPPTDRGDANCDGRTDIVDALVIAQLNVGNRQDVQTCPLADGATEANSIYGDLNSDGRTDIIDAMIIAQCASLIDHPDC